MWGFVNRVDEDYGPYLPEDVAVPNAGGLVQPYCDSPLDGEQIAENVYLNMITRAERYIYMESPYLIIGNEMMVSLCNAAKQGVDVRIITPHIGDHWYVHAMTRSNYLQLIESGVRIFEYTPGFIHAKVFVCDDQLAVVGTANMDYRSLYLHFECGALLYRTPAIETIYKDFLATQERCEEITLEHCKRTPWYRRAGRVLLKVFAPLM